MDKTCTTCNKTKTTRDFYRRNRKSTELASRCKECQSRINKLNYHKSRVNNDLPQVSDNCWTIINSNWRSQSCSG